MYVYSNLVEKMLLFPLIPYLIFWNLHTCDGISLSHVMIFPTITYNNLIKSKSTRVDLIPSHLKDHISLNVYVFLRSFSAQL